MKYVWIAVIVLAALLVLHLLVRIGVYVVYYLVKCRYDRMVSAYQRYLYLYLLVDTPKGTSASQINQQSVVTQVSEITVY